MVRIALLGDTHLALSKNTEFETNRFNSLIDTISIKKYDIVIFLGDLLDRARPSLEEIKLLQANITRLNAIGTRTIVLDGNHEAVTKESSTYDYLQIEGLDYMPYDRLELDDVSIQTLGYKYLNKYLIVPKADILLSHFRSSFGIIKEEIDTKEVAKKADVVFLGDIHQKYSPYDNVHYTGSPYSIHFTREAHAYGYIEIEIEYGTYKHKHVVLDLPCKRIVTAKGTDVSMYLDNTKDLLRIKVQGTSKELEELPRASNVNYITSLVLKEQVSQVGTFTSTDILETLITHIGDTTEARKVLTDIYKEIT